MKRFVRDFTVQGLNLERFLNLACAAGISLKGVRRKGRMLLGRCDEVHMDALRTLAENGGWSFADGGRLGSGRLMDAVNMRKALVAACLVALAAACGLYQLVWRVEVVDALQYEADAAAYLEQYGIRPFIPKRSIDLSALRDALEWRYPKVAWIDCGWRGTTLRITFFQGVPKGETVSHDGSGDIIASRAGIVESVVTIAGTPAVQSGDVVRQGDILIKGEERVGNEQKISVSARGIVKARVWDGVTVRMNAEEVQTTYTGRTEDVWYAACPWFRLWDGKTFAFEQADISRKTMPVGGLFIPVWLIHETRLEAEIHYVQRDQTELEAEAGAAALRILLRKLGTGDDLVDKWVDCCMIENEVVEAVAIGERVIDIAVPRRRD